MLKLNTDIVILGIKLRLELIILAAIIGGIAWLHLVGSCTTQQGYEMIARIIEELKVIAGIRFIEGNTNMGASLDYSPSNGVHNNKYEKKVGLMEVNQLGGHALRPQVPLPEGQLFYWANNNFDAKCCETSNVSGGNGCACITKEQNDFLNNRGGNRGADSEF
jgi:hypothetical protein